MERSSFSSESDSSMNKGGDAFILIFHDEATPVAATEGCHSETSIFGYDSRAPPGSLRYASTSSRHHRLGGAHPSLSHVLRAV
ncbi:hypothetical protein Nepgr_007097 [Nepenthes gracilis]|uniref:Uncharacterized protein n=1 Tax=Nepenthes gracilis TaxID=150966 RepID=A0AAD3S683_NEPGR|nr:hypothetical protein Nepgr_007097 [Nepenthes gracilis]